MPIRNSIFTDKPATVCITILMVAASLTAFRYRDLYHQWILHPFSVIRRKEMFRLFAFGFVHNDIVHLLINGVMAFFIGGQLEGFLRDGKENGSLIFVVIYFISHFAGALAVTWKNRSDNNYSSAGASGSILGCMMSFMILAPNHVAFFLPLAGGISNQFAALIMIVGLIVYRWRSGNELMDNELHFFSAAGGIVATILIVPQMI